MKKYKISFYFESSEFKDEYELENNFEKVFPDWKKIRAEEIDSQEKSDMPFQRNELKQSKTDIQRSMASPDIHNYDEVAEDVNSHHSQIKSLIDKDYKGKDMCKCGHDYSLHSPAGYCTWVSDAYGEDCCECNEFAKEKENGNGK